MCHPSEKPPLRKATPQKSHPSEKPPLRKATPQKSGETPKYSYDCDLKGYS